MREARDDASLGGTKTVQRWRMKDLLSDLDEEQAQPLIDWREKLGELVGRLVGMAAELLLWTVALLALAYVLWRYRDWLPWRREPAAERHAPPPLRHRGLAPEDVAGYDHPFLRDHGLSGGARSTVGPMGEIHDASGPDGRGALFDFRGVGAAQRERLPEGVLLAACRVQLAHLFGEAAAHPLHEALQDWAREPFTATEADWNAIR